MLWNTASPGFDEIDYRLNTQQMETEIETAIWILVVCRPWKQ